MNREFESGYATESAILHMAWQFHSSRMDFGMYSYDEVKYVITDQLENLGVYIPIPGTIPDPCHLVCACGRNFQQYCFT